MAFQIWRDYLQLNSVVQDMARAEVAKQPTPREVLLSPAKKPEENAMNEHNDYIQPNPGPQAQSTMLSPFSAMEPKLHPIHSYLETDSLVTFAQDQPAAIEASQFQPNLLGNVHGDESNAHQTKTCVQPNLSPQHGENEQSGICCFCKHNGESRRIYMDHNLKDEQGKVVCPILRIYTCSLCGATGDKSHTKKYCPLNKDKNCLYKKSGRNSVGRKIKR